MVVGSANLIDSDFRRSLLASIELFNGVVPDDISDLLTQCHRVDVKRAETLLSPDNLNDSIYIVLSGSLEVYLGSVNSPAAATLHPGSCTGEMSLVETQDRNTYVVATEDSHLMVLSHRILWQMIDRSHVLAKNLLIVISNRVRSDNDFIAERLGAISQAARNAVTEALTGLGNRHWMQEMFQRELDRERDDPGQLCLMMADVDNFKDINDELGHIAGDQILVAIAETLRTSLRPTDLIARFGGDEFAVLLPRASLDTAATTAERIRKDISGHADPELPVDVTISIGLTAAADADDLDRLLERADSAMYDAKDQGRDRVAIREADYRTGPLAIKS
jgi:diguanylate cyclase (GGDEF)-like protein